MKSSKTINTIFSILLILVCPIFAVYISNYILRGGIFVTISYLRNKIPMILITYFPLLFVTMIITFMTKKVSLAYLIIGLVSYLGARAHYYKQLFRGECLYPTDIVFLKNIGGMVSEFKIVPTKVIIIARLMLVVVVIVSFIFTIPRFRNGYTINIGLSVFSLFALLIYCRSVLFNLSFYSNTNIFQFRSEPADIYYANTFHTAFAYFYNLTVVEEPEGYGESQINTLLSKYSVERKNSNPDIILILDETYFYPDLIFGLNFSEDISANYKKISQKGIYGNMLSPKLGGGTGDVEFSVLNGINVTFFPELTVFPYVYGNSTLPSFIHHLKNNNYSTYALHAYTSALYNRANMYTNCGIDNIKFIDDYKNTEKLAEFVSDKSNILEIIDTYEAYLQNPDADNIFITSASMQNHVTMTPNILNGNHVELISEGYSDEFCTDFSALATYEYYSDQAIGYLYDYLQTIDREVIVIIYGDHQTYGMIDHYFNTDTLEEIEIYSGMSNIEKELRVHSTQFVIWSNKRDLGGIEYKFVSPSDLYAIASVEYDLPRTVKEEYLYGSLKELLAIDKWHGLYIDTNGSIVSEDEYKDTLKDKYAIMYDLLSGERYSVSN